MDPPDDLDNWILELQQNFRIDVDDGENPLELQAGALEPNAANQQAVNEELQVANNMFDEFEQAFLQEQDANVNAGDINNEAVQEQAVDVNEGDPIVIINENAFQEQAVPVDAGEPNVGLDEAAHAAAVNAADEAQHDDAIVNAGDLNNEAVQEQAVDVNEGDPIVIINENAFQEQAVPVDAGEPNVGLDEAAHAAAVNAADEAQHDDANFDFFLNVIGFNENLDGWDGPQDADVNLDDNLDEAALPEQAAAFNAGDPYADDAAGVPYVPADEGDDDFQFIFDPIDVGAEYGQHLFGGARLPFIPPDNQPLPPPPPPQNEEPVEPVPRDFASLANTRDAIIALTNLIQGNDLNWREVLQNNIAIINHGFESLAQRLGTTRRFPLDETGLTEYFGLTEYQARTHANISTYVLRRRLAEAGFGNRWPLTGTPDVVPVVIYYHDGFHTLFYTHITTTYQQLLLQLQLICHVHIGGFSVSYGFERRYHLLEDLGAWGTCLQHYLDGMHRVELLVTPIVAP